MKKQPSFVLKVSKKDAETQKEDLKAKGLYDNTREILRENDSIWLPVNKEIKGAVRKEIPRKDERSALKEMFGIKSFTIIGEIIIIFIPKEKRKYKEEIATKLMALYPKTKAVYRKVKRTGNIFRIQSLELIKGEGSETIHFENNLKFKLDVTKVFFSPRQVTERVELMEKIKHSNSVCVFFSGIGVIPIYVAKKTNAKRIVGIELNAEAHNYAQKNLQLNNIDKRVELIQGDVEKVFPKLIQEEKYEHIIMPLPKNAKGFITIAKKGLTKNGVITIYDVGSKKRLNNLKNEIERNGLRIKDLKKGGNMGPKEWRYTLHIKNKKL